MAIQAYERCRTVLADSSTRSRPRRRSGWLAEIRAAPAAAGAGAARRRRRCARPDAAGGPGRRTRDTPDEPRAEAARRTRGRRPPRGGARVGVLPLQLVGTTEAEAHLSHRAGRRDHRRAGAVPLDVPGLVLLAGALRHPDPRRDRDPARLRPRFPARRQIQRAGDRLRSRCACSTCAPATRWCGRAGSTASEGPAHPAGRGRRGGGGADRPRNPADQTQRVAARPVADATAYELVLRALPLMRGSSRRRSCRPANCCARRSRWSRNTPRRMPGSVLARVLFGQDWTAIRRRRSRRPGSSPNGRYARPAGRRGLTIAGHVRAYLYRRLREAMALHERA